jgi:signal transduction histidine kinase
MQERIGLVQGRFAVEPAPGGGTTVRAVVPLPGP